MSIISRLHPRFRVAAIQAPGTEAAIAKLLTFAATIIAVPADYIELVRGGTEIEILVDKIGYVRFWGPSGCIEMNEAYRFQEAMPHALAIGDNEGGDAIMWMNGPSGLALYLVDLAVRRVEQGVYVAESVRSYLVDGAGKSIGT